MNLFDLFVRIGLKDEATDKMAGIGDKLKKGLAVAGTAAAAGLGAATAAVGALTKASIDGYAEYEQLTGGVETLFKTSADSVIQYSQQAYQTAGMSANEYMETVTGFSASLMQSLGGDTAAAAEYANQAVIDMADNANKMGTDISMIQNAYQGFAKQNYTMLDNLKLGYGGTKEEMERLIADANAVKEANGEMADLSIDSFADVVEAIHTVQEEMGIAGATAEEADGTISGSVSAMKSAWENLVVGFADGNADIDVLMDNFLTSVETVAGNMLPVVERVLTSIFETLKENGPEMIESGAALLGELAAGALKAIPDIIKSIPDIVSAIVDGFTENAPEFKEIGNDIVEGIWAGISALGDWIGGKVSGFLDGIVDGAKDILGIHSPSTVFAGMGENMVAGLEKGWEDNIDAAKSDIESGLNFGTASVSYGASAAGRLGGAIAASAGGSASAVFDITTTLDGAVIARNQYRHNARESTLRGGSLVEVFG